jgi:hypothetical protein
MLCCQCFSSNDYVVSGSREAKFCTNPGNYHTVFNYKVWQCVVGILHVSSWPGKLTKIIQI